MVDWEAVASNLKGPLATDPITGQPYAGEFKLAYTVTGADMEEDLTNIFDLYANHLVFRISSDSPAFDVIRFPLDMLTTQLFVDGNICTFVVNEKYFDDEGRICQSNDIARYRLRVEKIES